MASNTRLKIYLIVILIGFLPALQYTINDMREEIVPTKNVYLALTPGEFAGTLLIGGFRGIAVDILWLRVQELQDEDKLFELIALTDLISKLQPHDRMVWEYMSWNRAYNISVKFPNSREDRWKWVKSGLDLNLEGIQRNPENWKLYKHMGFMFMHKCEDYQEETLQDYGENNFALARKYYRKLLELQPEAPLFIRRSIIHTYEKQGEFEEALKLYNEHIKKYPFDTIAKQNRDDYMKKKQQYKYYTDQVLKEYAQNKYERVIEIYEDNIVGKSYLMPNDTIEAILQSYLKTDNFDKGIDFIHARLKLKIEDRPRIFSLYETYTAKYNAHYNKKFSDLIEDKSYNAVYKLYTQKFREKKVDISLENGIIILESLIQTGDTEEAGSLFIELFAWYPDSEKLAQFRKLLHDTETKTLQVQDNDDKQVEKGEIQPEDTDYAFEICLLMGFLAVCLTISLWIKKKRSD